MDATLDISLLRTLIAIDEFGGFGRAADALQCSQPTVSQHVRVLERRLGHPLVEKQGRGAGFTAAGERLLVEARRIIAVHDDALRRLRAREATEPVADATATLDTLTLGVGTVGVDADGITQVAGFLHFVAERVPRLIGEWEAGRDE